MNTFTLILSCLLLACSTLFGEDLQTIPPGVRYKRIDDTLNNKIRSDLLSQFAKGSSGVSTLFQHPCVCAPAYWKVIKARPNVKFAHAVPSNFQVPDSKSGQKQILTGATFKNSDDLEVLAKLFAADVGSNPVIRRLKSDEISLFWAIVPFDIEEPVFILENKNRHFLLHLVKDASTGKYYAFWIDEISAYTVSKK